MTKLLEQNGQFCFVPAIYTSHEVTDYAEKRHYHTTEEGFSIDAVHIFS